MSHNALKSGLVIALTVLVASSVAAQDGGRRNNGGGQGSAQAGENRGNGGGQRGSGHSANSSGSSSTANSGTSSAGSGSNAGRPHAGLPDPKPLPGYGRPHATNTWGIDRRQDYQSDEIRWGQRRGLITENEAKSLRAEQERIAEMERRAKADGNVSREERHQIRRSQREAEWHIREEMYDRERNGGHGHRRWGHGWRGWW